MFTLQKRFPCLHPPIGGIGGKLLLSFSVMALLSLAMGLIAWAGFGELSEKERQVSAQAVPDLVTARQLSDLSSRIIFSAQSLADAETNRERLEKGRYLSASCKSLGVLLSEFSSYSYGREIFDELGSNAREIIKNLAVMGEKVGERIELDTQLKLRQQELEKAATAFSRLARSQVANADATLIANITRLYNFYPADRNPENVFSALDQLVEVDVDMLERMVTLELRAHRVR